MMAKKRRDVKKKESENPRPEAGGGKKRQ